MIRIELADEALSDLERFVDHLLAHGVANAEERVGSVVLALDIMTEHPQIGRPAGGRMRELVIGRDAEGYVALYCYVASQGIVRVLAFRAQKETGYQGL
jgi:toxin ParE1/3/4